MKNIPITPKTVRKFPRGLLLEPGINLHLYVGAQVKFSYGSEAWTFSKARDAIHTVEAIRVISDEYGIITHAFIKLVGRKSEVHPCELVALRPARIVPYPAAAKKTLRKASHAGGAV